MRKTLNSFCVTRGGVSTRLRQRRRIFSNDDVDSGSGRLRTLRDLELRAAWFSIRAQSRLLVRRRLSRRRSERVFNHRYDALAKRSDFRRYAEAVLAGGSAVGSVEQLTPEMKRAEKVALTLRTNDGLPAELLERFQNETREFLQLGLLRRANGNSF